MSPISSLRFQDIFSILLLQAFTELLVEEDTLILSESERKLLVDGEPAEHRNQERIQIRAFVEILINLDIRSITFARGLGKEELVAFVQAMSMRPDTARAGGGLQEILDRQAVRHILINEKMFVARDKDQQIVASLNLKDDEIMNMLMEGSPETADLQQIMEKAKDPEWISEIFQTGMKHIVEQQGSTPGVQLSEKLVHMVRMLEKIADPVDQEQLASLVARSVAEMDNEMISLVLSRDVRNLFGGRLFEDVVGELADERFAEVADGLARIGGKARAGILLSVLARADDQLKMSIVETLGAIKARQAVPVLMEILQSKSVSVSALKADVEEKICNALGNICVREALPALVEIAGSKGFFSGRSYQEKVKIAAGKAAASITRR